MEEVPFAGEHHRDAELVGLRDRGIVLHRAARLDDDGNTGLRGRLDAVGERVERVARTRAALGAPRRLLGRDLPGLDAVLLPRADAPRNAIAYEHDRVRLH